MRERMSPELIQDIRVGFGCSDAEAVEIAAAADRIRTHVESLLIERNLLTDTAAFLALRSEWKAQGCPRDHPYARLCAEVAAEASGPAIGIRDGDTYRVVEL